MVRSLFSDQREKERERKRGSSLTRATDFAFMHEQSVACFMGVTFHHVPFRL